MKLSASFSPTPVRREHAYSQSCGSFYAQYKLSFILFLFVCCFREGHIFHLFYFITISMHARTHARTHTYSLTLTLSHAHTHTPTHWHAHTHRLKHKQYKTDHEYVVLGCLTGCIRNTKWTEALGQYNAGIN